MVNSCLAIFIDIDQDNFLPYINGIGLAFHESLYQTNLKQKSINMEATQTAVATKWTLDPTHSELGFKVKHLMISNVKGHFKNFDIEMEGEDFTKSKVTVSIDASSIYTNNEDRDTHLKSGDFFDAEQYPKLTFTSNNIEKLEDDEYEMTGELSIKGQSKPVTLNVELGGFMKDPYGNDKVGFSVNTKINRTDWGLNWNAALETGGILVGEEVKISGEVQLVKQ